MSLDLILKTVHLTGVVLLVGNVIVTGLWNLRAVATRDARIIAFAQREVMLADWWLTLGGGALLSVSGLMLMWLRGYELQATPWIWQGLGLLGIATLLWLVILLPAQLGMIRLSRLAEAEGALPPEFYPLFVRWNWVGWGATVLLLIALALMVIKPA